MLYTFNRGDEYVNKRKLFIKNERFLRFKLN